MKERCSTGDEKSHGTLGFHNSEAWRHHDFRGNILSFWSRRELCFSSFTADEELWSEADSSCSGQPIHLWQFLRELLLKPHNYGRCIRWLNKDKGISSPEISWPFTFQRQIFQQCVWSKEVICATNADQTKTLNTTFPIVYYLRNMYVVVFFTFPIFIKTQYTFELNISCRKYYCY